jgi:hypothetical protein
MATELHKASAAQNGRKNKVDRTGLVYGRLTVLSEAPRRRASLVEWHCRCECGKLTTVRACNLQSGSTVSCGCKHKAGRAKSHGMGSQSIPEYAAWSAAKGRCNNPKNIMFPIYGGRGIFMSAEFADDFACFLEHVGPRPSDRHSLERKDVNKGYERGNLCWATAEEQANNKTTSVILTCNGKSQTIAQWAEELSINYVTLWGRLERGWSVERALTQPVRVQRLPASSEASP